MPRSSTLFPTTATAVTQSAKWTTLTNATGSGTGTTSASWAVYTTAVSAEVGTIELSGYAASTNVNGGTQPTAVDGAIGVITFNVATTARWTSVTAQMYSGATAIGSATTLTLSATTSNSQTIVFTGTPTWAQLSDLRVRLSATKSGTQSSTFNVDAVGVAVNYSTGTAAWSAVTDTVSSMTGLVARFRAAELHTVGGGSNAHGASITNWTSKGIGTAITGTGMLAYPSDINSRPAIRFNGLSNDYSNGTSVHTAVTNRTYGVVLAVRVTTATERRVIHSGTAVVTNVNSTQAQIYFGTSNQASASGVVSAATAAVWTASGDTASADALYINGTSVVSADAGAAASETGFRLGSLGSSGWLDGDVAEVVVWDHVLNATERQTWHKYVQDQYGVTVSDYPTGDHPTTGTASATASASGVTTSTSTTTGTATATASATRTGSSDRTKTATATATATATRTGSSSRTTARTATATATATGVALQGRPTSGTATATATATATRTSTRVKTATATATASASGTPSSSRAKTGTATATASASSTKTTARTTTATATATATATRTGTSSRVTARSASASATATRTGTSTRVTARTAGATATATGTTTKQGAGVTSGTATATASATATKTTTRPTARTATATASASSTATSSRLTTRSATATATATAATTARKLTAGVATAVAGASWLTTTMRTQAGTAYAVATASALSRQAAPDGDFAIGWGGTRARLFAGSTRVAPAGLLAGTGTSALTATTEVT